MNQIKKLKIVATKEGVRHAIVLVEAESEELLRELESAVQELYRTDCPLEPKEGARREKLFELLVYKHGPLDAEIIGAFTIAIEDVSTIEQMIEFVDL